MQKKVKDKVNKALNERPVKSNRGRKSTDLEEYIKKSQVTIKEYEDQLVILRKDMGKGPEEKKAYETLYNKKTALQSRLKKRINVAETSSKLIDGFPEFSKLLSNLINPTFQAKIVNQITKQGKKMPSGLMGISAVTKEEFQDALEKFVQSSP